MNCIIPTNFDYTIKAITDRLEYNTEVKNSVDTSLSLLHKEAGKTKVKNLYNRLSTYIDKLKVLFDDKCTEKQAIEAWNEFFNHSYSSGMVTENAILAKNAGYSILKT